MTIVIAYAALLCERTMFTYKIISLLSLCVLTKAIFVSMEEHDNVVRNLNEEFRKIDRAYKNSEMRVFGKANSE